jgi:DNA-binding IclR family transcriptional regulator
MDLLDMPLARTPEFHEPKNSLTAVRLTAEFREMPGLRLTTKQTARLIGVDVETASSLLTTLVDRGFLRLTANGYVLA